MFDLDDCDVDIQKKHKKGYSHYENKGNVITFGTPFPQDPQTKLSPGVYTLGHDRFLGWYVEPTSTKVDGLIDLPDTVSDQILKEVDQFLTIETKEKFDKYNLLYKRGILLHGAPGTGKTCTIFKTMEKMVERGGVVFFNPNPGGLIEVVNNIREIEPDKPIMVVYEELEDWLYDEEQILSLLDGETQLDNIIYLATTNYIDKIPPRLKNRPSRFASVIEVGMPTKEARSIYFNAKLDDDDKENIDEMIEKTENMSIDHLKDLIVSTKCFSNDLDTAIAKLKQMNALDLRNDE